MRIRDLFTEELESILNDIMETAVFEPGEQLFHAGESGDCCYLIDQGEVRIEADRDEIDTDSVLAYVGEGNVVGKRMKSWLMPFSLNATKRWKKW